jgi:hypothetical protein
VFVPVFVATGATPAEAKIAEAAVRERVAFYGATPAYQAVLADLGHEDLQARLNWSLTDGRVDRMVDDLPDEVLRAVAIIAPPDEVGAEVARRFAGAATRISIHAPYPAPLEQWRDIALDIRRAWMG